MKSHNIHNVFLLLSLTGLAACSQPVPPADNTGNPAAGATTGPAPAKAAAEGVEGVEGATHVEEGVTFSVDPANVYACKGRDRTTSVIRWTVQRPEVKLIKVLISDEADQDQKTFAVMGTTGEATTGNWVIAGLVIELVDGDSGKELARHTVNALPCD